MNYYHLLCFILFPHIIITKLFSLHQTKTSSFTSLRNLLSDTSVYGSSYALNYYYANLYLGTPPIKQSYIIDTGSSITTAPCQPFCQNCGKHLNSYYTVNNTDSVVSCDSSQCSMVQSSSCNKEKQCTFSISYSEGSSLSGIFINETIRIGDDFKASEGYYLPIGCTVRENNLFLTQLADGIMGLSNSDKNFVTMLYNEKIIKRNLFSLCLSQKGGYFSIEDINTKYHSEPIKYITINKSGFYNININSITINALKIPLLKDGKQTYGAIVDSGTTVTYIPSDLANKIINEINNHCSKEENKGQCGIYQNDKELGPCFTFDNETHLENALNVWPNITFDINGEYSYVWTPKNYYFNDTDDKGNYKACLGFLETFGTRFTLGSTWMHGHDILFNRETNSIAFVRADCDRGNPNPTGEEDFNDLEKEEKERKEKCYKQDVNKAKKVAIAYTIVSIVLIAIIVFLSIAICKLKKGKNFLCIKMVTMNDIGNTRIDIDSVKTPKNSIELTNSSNV